jgi:hypothetical protein
MANAVLCAWLVLTRLPEPVAVEAERASVARTGWAGRTLAWGLLAAVLAIFGGWAFKRAVFGDRFAPHFYTDHIRVGPNNTNDKK